MVILQFYQLSLYDKEQNYLGNFKTTESQFVLPPGLLRENRLYRYRIHTRREFFEDNGDNGSSVPSFGTGNANTFFTTPTYGTSPPSLNLDSYGVAFWHGPDPATGVSVYALDFLAMVTDTDGVPENIERVEVIYPDGIDDEAFRKILVEEGVVVAASLADYAGKSFRLGHMGHIDKHVVVSTLSAIERTLFRVGYQVEFGKTINVYMETLRARNAI